jgi:hypothetical protein
MVIVCFVGIGGTVDHHCLSFLFIDFSGGKSLLKTVRGIVIVD